MCVYFLRIKYRGHMSTACKRLVKFVYITPCSEPRRSKDSVSLEKHVAAEVHGYRFPRYVALVSAAGASALEEYAAAMEGGLAEGWTEPLLVNIPCKQSNSMIFV